VLVAGTPYSDTPFSEVKCKEARLDAMTAANTQL
jgi:hypothetical protein